MQAAGITKAAEKGNYNYFKNICRRNTLTNVLLYSEGSIQISKTSDD